MEGEYAGASEKITHRVVDNGLRLNLISRFRGKSFVCGRWDHVGPILTHLAAVGTDQRVCLVRRRRAEWAHIGNVMSMFLALLRDEPTLSHSPTRLRLDGGGVLP